MPSWKGIMVACGAGFGTWYAAPSWPHQGGGRSVLERPSSYMLASSLGICLDNFKEILETFKIALGTMRGTVPP